MAGRGPGRPLDRQRTRLKVCCIASLQEADAAIRLGADALGLVGEMPSGPGVISDDLVTEIARQVPPEIDTFLLTSRTRAEDIVDHVTQCATTTVQIVRHIEPGEYSTIIRRVPDTRRVQVIHVEDDSALELIDAYETYVHAFLLDSGRPNASIAELGGTGRAHDWQISARIVRKTTRPVYLAGGLNATNVRAAIDSVGPFGIDICSGVRTSQQLDSAKLDALTEQIWPSRSGRPGSNLDNC